MTGYKITVGYNSRFSKEEVAIKLLEIGQHIANNTETLAQEAVKFGFIGTSIAMEYALPFQMQEDLTIQFITEPHNYIDEEDQTAGNFYSYIWMLASGGGESRKYKEEVRRAYCRLILVEMHKLGMEININID